RRSGIDDRDFAAPDDVSQGAGEGEWARVVGEDAPNTRDNLLDLAGLEIEFFVKGNVAGHDRPLSSPRAGVNPNSAAVRLPLSGLVPFLNSRRQHCATTSPCPAREIVRL